MIVWRIVVRGTQVGETVRGEDLGRSGESN